jgi:phage terminase large subunit-like protein
MNEDALGHPMRLVSPVDHSREPRCETARQLLAPGLPPRLPRPPGGPAERLAEITTWSTDTQERALQLLRDRELKPWHPFYCPNACDGAPHGDWAWPHARADQRPPPMTGDWLVWLLLGGRGSGKTRTGAEATHRMSKKVPRMTLIAPTGPDLRETMIEGEALALDTPVPTPYGWLCMGDLQVGDVIYAGDGTECQVTEAFPVLHDRPCFRVMFEGEEITADAEHKWVTSTHLERSYETRPTCPMSRYEAVRTTEQIASQLHTQAGWTVSQHAVRAVAVPGRFTELPVPPYTLGYWLGDGSRRGGHITAHPDDQDHARARIEKDGYPTRMSYGQDRRGYTFLVPGLSADLLAAGLLNNKHIPTCYLSAAADQRLELVRGLMDSDGCVSARGQFEFSNKNRRLVLGMIRLLSSLGVKTRVVWRSSGQARLRGTTHLPIFSMPRKAARLPSARREQEWRYVTAVEPVDSVPVRCIAVDSADHTFLVGDHYVRTHNSGVQATAPPDAMPQWEPSKKKLTWPNGAVALGFSGEEPDRLRGPQAYWVWIDEPAHMPLIGGEYGVWDNMMFGLRLGRNPWVCATTTPKPLKWLKTLINDADTRVSRVSSYANLANLAPPYLKILQRYEGTRVGRQELHAEILEDVEGALWKADYFTYGDLPDQFDRIVVAVDPAGTKNKRSDLTGIVVLGIADRCIYVLADLSDKYSPSGWATAAHGAYTGWSADAIVAEKNYGGDMVREVLEKNGAKNVRIILVHSRRGKALRAEPIVALYERTVKHPSTPLIRHLRGVTPDLEDEQLTWVPGVGDSPNRVDALVHGATELAGADPTAEISAPPTGGGYTVPHLSSAGGVFHPAAHAAL